MNGRTLAFLLALSPGFLPSSAGALEISATADPAALTSTIMGPGISLFGDLAFLAGDASTGTFAGGLAAGLGFESGILLTTGTIARLDGPNKFFLCPASYPERIGGGPYAGLAWDTSADLGVPGDPGLEALAGFPTYDAAVLEFDFQFDGGQVFFNYVFGSEEYVNYVGTDFNDVFGFWLDGVNLAVVPGTDTPVTINAINPLVNGGLYRNNVDYLDAAGNLIPGGGFDLEFDGLTTVLTAASGELAPGTHHMKIAIADASDGLLDSGVFLQAGTFSNKPTPVPEPSSLLLLASGLGGLLLIRRKGRS